MANHASHGALPYPVKGARFTVLIPYLDADGDPTDPTTGDSEVSKDNGNFADCTEEISVPTTNRGMAMLTLTGAELDASIVALYAGNATAKATLLTLSPRVLPVLFSGTAQAGAASTLTLATNAPAIAELLIGCILKTTGGTGGGGTGGANNQARVITGYTTGRVATVSPAWETTPDNTTTYEVLLTETSIISYADIRAIEGSGTDGNNATLTLKQLHISNSGGSAVVASSTGSNGHGIEASGNGSGEGLRAVGGATGNGIEGVGGSTNGDGLKVSATDGSGVNATGGANGHGLRVVGAGTGEGISAQGGATGHGIEASGGATSGDGLKATATSGNGITGTGGTNGDGIGATGAGGGAGLAALGGPDNSGIWAVGFHGIQGLGTSANGHGIYGLGFGDGHGLRVEGVGSGDGLSAQGGITGHGINAMGGSTNGDGIRASGGSTLGDGIRATTVGGVKLSSSDFGGSVVGDASNSATSFKTDLTQTATDHWKHAFLRITSGTLKGQVRRVSAYNGSTKFVTVEDGFSATPADNVTFDLIAE